MRNLQCWKQNVNNRISRNFHGAIRLFLPILPRFRRSNWKHSLGNYTLEWWIQFQDLVSYARWEAFSFSAGDQDSLNYCRTLHWKRWRCVLAFQKSRKNTEHCRQWYHVPSNLTVQIDGSPKELKKVKNNIQKRHNPHLEAWESTLQIKDIIFGIW